MDTFRRTEPYAPRPVSALPPIERGGWRVKAYAITYGSAPLQRAVYDRGLDIALDALPRPAVTPARPGVGFVIFHQGRGVHYLVLSWWDNENEYFNRVFVRPIEGDQPWRPASGSESACVWDLEIIWHERNAYVRHVLSPPTGTDIDGYLADVLRAAPTL